MKIRVIGGGWYGAHITLALLRDGHDVELHEIADRLFAGASGSNPARLHLGWHYPRSALTRQACQAHHAAFMAEYGHLTRAVPVNIYAVAAEESLVDFGTYQRVTQGLECVTIHDQREFGLQNVEGAVLTGERHIVIDDARAHFEKELDGVAKFETKPDRIDDPAYDLTVDCTFCANDAENIDRFEPCVTGLLHGPTDRAVTIMDGPFPSVYPWNESRGLCSLTSAKFTPLARCKTRQEAEEVLRTATASKVDRAVRDMFDQIRHYWPAAEMFKPVGSRLSIRAMPKSGSAARLVDVIRVGERALRVRAGKIDAILHAAEVIRSHLAGGNRVQDKHCSVASAAD